MKKGRFLWSAHRITEKQKAGKARNIKEKQLKSSRSTARELAAAIERFLDTQSKENRVLFMRRYWYADSFAEIGKLLGITEGNARLRLTRMRKQLKTYLTEQEVLV